eukprot:scpid93938/ scgid14136/ 
METGSRETCDDLEPLPRSRTFQTTNSDGHIAEVVRSRLLLSRQNSPSRWLPSSHSLFSTYVDSHQTPSESRAITHIREPCDDLETIPRSRTFQMTNSDRLIPKVVVSHLMSSRQHFHPHWLPSSDSLLSTSVNVDAHQPSCESRDVAGIADTAVVRLPPELPETTGDEGLGGKDGYEDVELTLSIRKDIGSCRVMQERRDAGYVQLIHSPRLSFTSQNEDHLEFSQAIVPECLKNTNVTRVTLNGQHITSSASVCVLSDGLLKSSST